MSLTTCWCAAALNESETHDFADVEQCYSATCPHTPTSHPTKPSTHPSTHPPAYPAICCSSSSCDCGVDLPHKATAWSDYNQCSILQYLVQLLLGHRCQRNGHIRYSSVGRARRCFDLVCHRLINPHVWGNPASQRSVAKRMSR